VLFKTKYWVNTSIDLSTTGICHLKRVKLDDFIRLYSSCKTLGIGKAIPVQNCIGPEGSSLLSLPDFKTFGKWNW
jgi:hypothetical protein